MLHQAAIFWDVLGGLLQLLFFVSDHLIVDLHLIPHRYQVFIQVHLQIDVLMLFPRLLEFLRW